MKIARVIGSIVSTVKHRDHEGAKLMLVKPVDCEGVAGGDAFVAVDAAQAGVGDYVLVVEEGKSARQVMDKSSLPCEAIIVGVIDHLLYGGHQRVLTPGE